LPATTAASSAATHDNCPMAAKPPATTRKGAGTPMRAASVAAKTIGVPWAISSEVTCDMGAAVVDARPACSPQADFQ
jgi:hypothetical protein